MPDFPEPLGLVIGDATRLYTVKHGGYKQVLSVGRVQTYTGNGCRSLCCNREF
jgi:hypothetical protein